MTASFDLAPTFHVHFSERLPRIVVADEPPKFDGQQTCYPLQGS
jgi:hypothetical protein